MISCNKLSITLSTLCFKFHEVQASVSVDLCKRKAPTITWSHAKQGVLEENKAFLHKGVHHFLAPIQNN